MRKYAFVLVLLSPVLATADGPRQKLNTDEKAELQGSWVAAETAGFGTETPREELRGLRLVIQGNHLTAHYGEKTAEATFRLHANHTPAWIDVTITKGPADVQGKTFHGIYLVEGNVLRVAFPDPGQARPKVFAAPNQTQVHGILFRKQTKR
jgi:uncharacterized protein (TIGR03067 family)